MQASMNVGQSALLAAMNDQTAPSGYYPNTADYVIYSTDANGDNPQVCGPIDNQRDAEDYARDNYQPCTVWVILPLFCPA